MEAAPPPGFLSRERSHRPSYTSTSARASSRSSTSYPASSRMAAPYSDRVAANPTPSPQPTLLQSQRQHSHAPFLVHRFQDANSTRNTPSPASTESSRYRPPRDANDDAKVSATSSYLQEKLLRERRVESERSASRMSIERTAATGDLHASQGAASPVRPRSGNGNGDIKKKGGVGLKEMEQTMTSLHKQNFDLKLELYHRRQKQATLEERCETLESEKREVEDINDKLMSELEMRDKAVEEAVSMIITLEARLEQLLREREMVHELEKQSLLASNSSMRRALSTASRPVTKDSTAFDHAARGKQKQLEEPRTLARMPSFLSEKSVNTENLRNVYLGSLVSLPRMSEDTLDGDYRDAANRISSPSLSVLSESSFLSIYGRKTDSRVPSYTATLQPPYTWTSSVPADIPRSMPEHLQNVSDLDNAAPAMSAENVETNNAAHRNNQATSLTPTKKRSSSASRVLTGPGGLNALTDFIGTNSPLQRLEKMELSLQAMSDASRPNSMDGEAQQSRPLAPQLREQEIGNAAKDKRDTLRRVKTDASFSRGLNSSHNLPPTPDTISTSTLRRYKNSNDTLAQDKTVSNDASYLAPSEAPTSTGNGRHDTMNGQQLSPQPPSMTAFNGRLFEADVRSSHYSNQLRVPPRPRSADETTLSHQGRGSVWGDSESSDDDMDIDGNDSASMQDCWLRESLRPTGQPTVSRSRRGGRASPDLFNFPSSSNGWSTTDMFGKSGQSFSPGLIVKVSAPYAHALDALGASLPAPAGGLFGQGGLLASPLPYGLGSLPAGPPPPPNRRSSLNAQTGGMSPFSSRSRSGSRQGSISIAPGTPRMSMSVAKTRRSPTRASAAKESNAPTGDVDNNMDTRPQPKLQVQAQLATAVQQAAAAAKPRHYPPTSGTTPRSRVLSLFRRSGSHEQSSPQQSAPASAPATETTFSGSTIPRTMTAPVMGMPSKMRRDLDSGANVSSATPPPILRSLDGASTKAAGDVTNDNGNSAVMTEVLVDGSSSKDVTPVQTPTTTDPVQETQVLAEDGNAGVAPKKKWLGSLGRVTNLRNRAG